MVEGGVLGVFGGVAAAVVRFPVVEGALHLALADGAAEQTAQGVAAVGGAGLSLKVLLCAAGLALGLCVGEGGLGDQRFVDRLCGPDPLLGVVPGEFGAVAEGDVVDVERTSSLRCLFHTSWPV
ncbi:hypothetical protein ACFY12_08550 [Streptomyces sp. NPDC001339]|uniref:hypothetical protein n=1 Tax=Streptomyces sp. NPDC001339 TaxID=3364563 RepID=UPI0036872349